MPVVDIGAAAHIPELPELTNQLGPSRWVSFIYYGITFVLVDLKI